MHWGPPGDANPPCRNRRQVLQWYERGRAAGRRASVTDLEVHGDALLIGLRLETGEERWQVMRVGPEGVTDIRGYEDRTGASANCRSDLVPSRRCRPKPLQWDAVDMARTVRSPGAGREGADRV